jgi:mRNA interferase MazF
MIYNQFDVVLVPFPFTDKNVTKKRPALILNNKDYQIKTNHLILAMITSAKNTQWINDFEIKELENTGLKTNCVIRYKVFSLDERIILKKIGFISANEQIQIKEDLSNLI